MATFPTENDDQILGTSGFDMIDGRAGADEIYGLAGDDSLLGGQGDDQLYGGQGNDTLSGGVGYDGLRGEDGDDLLFEAGGDGFNELHGGNGRDEVVLAAGYGVLLGDDGDDLLRFEGEGYGRAEGGEGQDVLRGGVGADELLGGAGYDVLTGGQGKDVYAGTLAELNGDIIIDYEYGEDIRLLNTSVEVDSVRLVTENARSHLEIDANHDGYFETRIEFGQLVTGALQFSGDTGYNTIIRVLGAGGYGNPTDGADYIVGSLSEDNIDALAGNDEVLGQGGDDTLNGGQGDDRLDGGDGADLLDGGDGFDVLSAGEGDDTLTDSGGDWGYGRLYGGGGADRIVYMLGNAEAYGEDGDDYIAFQGEASGIASGGWGNDRLIGGDRFDELDGGADADTLTGGAGADLFRAFVHEIDGDVITDYQWGEKIQLLGKVATLSDLQLLEDGSDTLLKIDADGDGAFEATLRLAGVTGGALVLTPGRSWENDSFIRVVNAAGMGQPTEESDLIVGTGGADQVKASYGDDEVIGLGGADSLAGEAGDDLLIGGNGDDSLDGGAGLDTLYGDSGADTLSDGASDGRDSNLFGGEGGDRLVVNADFGWLYGEAGNDTLIFAGTSQGTGEGGSGADVLVGGGKADRLLGGEGRDTITGGGGGDYFEGYSWDVDGDLITDYQYGEQLYFYMYPTASTVQLLTSGPDTLLKLDAGGDGIFETTVTLQGVVAGRLAITPTGYVSILADAGRANTAPTGASSILYITEDMTVRLKLADFVFKDVDGHSLASIRIASAPTSGVLRVNGVNLQAGDSISAADLFAGGVTFTPGANLNGPGAASFTFQVQDTGGGSDLDLTPDKLTFSIATVNDAPRVAGPAFLPTANEDTVPAGVSVASVLAGAFDDSADQVAGGSSANALAGVAIVSCPSSPAQGVWQYSTNSGGSWTAIPTSVTSQFAFVLSASTLIRFLPGADFNGPAPALKAHLIDTSLGSLSSPFYSSLPALGGSSRFSADTVTLNAEIAPVNDAPTAPSSKTLAVEEDKVLTVSADAADRDGDVLSYSLKTGPTHGQATFTATGYTYKPSADYAGADQFVVIISDGRTSVEQVANVTVTPVEDAPTGPASRTISTQEDASSALTAISVTDPDGDLLSYVVKLGAGPAHGSVGLADGKFVYTPAANFNGADQFTLVVSDGKTVFEQVVSVAVTPVNDAPTLISAYADQKAAQGALFSLKLSGAFGDLDDPTLTYAVSNAAGGALPSWLKLTGDTLAGAPTGVEDYVSVKVMAKDAAGLIASDTVDLYIGRIFNGGSGVDRYVGGRGDDSINGGKGNDELTGGSGGDLITGAAGDDRLTGGAGADIFVIGAKSGADRISDFALGVDTIRLVEGVTAPSWSSTSTGTVVNLSGGATITLAGVTNMTRTLFSELFE